MKGGGKRMISFEGFLMEDGIPIYLQIVLWLKRGIAAGQIVDGDELPSRRVLSALLGVNPNTVQKAYRMLEEEGLIQSQGGAKSTVVLAPQTKLAVRQTLLQTEIKSIVSAMAQMGLSKEEALALVDTYWEDHDET